MTDDHTGGGVIVEGVEVVGVGVEHGPRSVVEQEVNACLLKRICVEQSTS